MNTPMPLGLPEGTVRAILALMILAATLAYWLIYKTIPTEFLGLAGIVVGYYFGSREGQASGQLQGYIAGANGSLTSSDKDTDVVCLPSVSTPLPCIPNVVPEPVVENPVEEIP
jgi:hypothetical protein